jgi:hypothetical protein
MNGLAVVPIVLAVVVVVMLATHHVPRWVSTRMRRARSISAEQWFRADAAARRLLSPSERVAWDADAARRARRVK